MLIAIYLCAVGSIMLVAVSLLQREAARMTSLPRDDTKPKQPFEESRDLIRKSRFFAFNSSFLNNPKIRKGLEGRLSSAETNILPEEFLAIKEALSLFFVLAVFFLLGQHQPLRLLVAALAGFYLPELYLKQRIHRHKASIAKALPDTIDLLTLCVGSGLDFMIGLEWVIRRSKANPLTKEFAWVIHEVSMGRSRQETLMRMAKRLEMPEVSSFVHTLVHADRMGSPISEVLSVLSEEARTRRFQRGERLALQAPIKMLFPLVLFILPAVGIIVGAPILLEFMKGNLLKF